MSDFLKEFTALMASSAFGNPNQFSKKTGAKTPTLTKITKYGSLPSVELLSRWLKKGRVEKPVIDRLVFLLRLERVRMNKELAPLFAYQDARLRQLTIQFEALLDYFVKLGIEPPHTLLQSIGPLMPFYE